MWPRTLAVYSTTTGCMWYHHSGVQLLCITVNARCNQSKYLVEMNWTSCLYKIPTSVSNCMCATLISLGGIQDIIPTLIEVQVHTRLHRHEPSAISFQLSVCDMMTLYHITMSDFDVFSLCFQKVSSVPNCSNRNSLLCCIGLAHRGGPLPFQEPHYNKIKYKSCAQKENSSIVRKHLILSRDSKFLVYSKSRLMPATRLDPV